MKNHLMKVWTIRVNKKRKVNKCFKRRKLNLIMNRLRKIKNNYALKMKNKKWKERYNKWKRIKYHRY
jgi:hypothetical protein